MAVQEYLVFGAIGTALLVIGHLHLRLSRGNPETSLGVSLMGLFGVLIFSALTVHLA